MSDRPWFYTVANLADLWDFMAWECSTPDPGDFLTNPQNYEAEWKRMLKAEEEGR